MRQICFTLPRLTPLNLLLRLEWTKLLLIVLADAASCGVANAREPEWLRVSSDPFLLGSKLVIFMYAFAFW